MDGVESENRCLSGGGSGVGEEGGKGVAIMIDRRRGALIGLAMGDALGAAIEFKSSGWGVLGRVWYIQIVANGAGTDGYAGGGVEGDSGSVVELKEINSNGKSCIR